MARLQSLTQQHFLERGLEPTTSRFIGGISGTSEGVPKMHPLKSSMPVFRASSLLHGLRMRKPSLRLPSLSVRVPRY